jgi:pimeloyl-ACP methyl ester carboxylesterase
MRTRDEPVSLVVAGSRLGGTFVTPTRAIPGVLFVHGWGGDQRQYLSRAREVATLGSVCLTFDLRGHGGGHSEREVVTREDNLQDVLAAYDRLVAHHGVDPAAIAVVGSSYGAYLACILTTRRHVRWLGLRAPALYRDTGWQTPKQAIDRDDLHRYRSRRHAPDASYPLRACRAFEGDVLLVESAHDDIIPHPVIESYLDACTRARSLTYRVLDGADHGLTTPASQHAYTALVSGWLAEMFEHVPRRERGA